MYVLDKGNIFEKMEILKVLYEDEKDNFSSENIYLLISIADSYKEYMKNKKKYE